MRTRIESHPATVGNNLNLLVTLGCAVLLGTAVLASVGRGKLFNQQNLLYVALVFYAAAAVLYLGFGIAGRESHVHFAWLATGVGLLANTLAAANRWYIAGHPPFSSLYETLLTFTLTLAALTLVVELRYGMRLVGTVTMPLAVLSVILMELLPADVHPLAPALQSTWLHVHVTMAMLAYAACAVSFALALMFLIQDRVPTGTFLAWCSAMLVVLYAGILIRADAAGGLAVAAWDPSEGREILFAKHTPLLVIIPGLGAVALLVLAALSVPLALYAFARWKRSDRIQEWANEAFFIAIFFQLVTAVVFMQRLRGGEYPSRQAPGLFTTSPAASPFIIAGLFAGLAVSLLYVMLAWRRPVLERLFPAADRLDRLTYKTISIAFPLLTLMIATGAYWANRTWGAYWSWDPKETWALITWLTYVAYLHMRIARGWRGRRAAYFAIIGFAVVVFTFFGVTYLLPGLHSYA
ncbi:MAG TPA: cytochrome c biogenesis protein CcsA [Terriglobia bacterium]|nr:cytochrome c biogenesis protein CcsA [Terriglobia bacterium]